VRQAVTSAAPYSQPYGCRGVASPSASLTADLTFAQFVLLTPFPGTLDFEKWASQPANRAKQIDGIPITQHWLIPEQRRPKLYVPHPALSLEDIRARTQGAWDRFYSWPNVWARSRVVESLKARLTFVLISKLYRQMYANTGIATDSARVARSNRWARWLGVAVRRLFLTTPMPQLQMPRPVVETLDAQPVMSHR
jgi:hypothetical protein